MSNAVNNRKTSSQGVNAGVIALIITLAVVIVLLFVVVAVMLKGRSKKDTEAQADPTTGETTRREVVSEDVRAVLDEESAASVMEQMREEVAEGMFECQMSMNWTFDDGQAESRDAYVANSDTNTHPLYFDVILQDNEETIYSSPVLPVGTELTNFKLDKELPAGTYQATVMYHLLKDTESQEEVSAAGFVVNIEVLN